MCGRFALNETPRKLAEHFDLTGDLDLSSSWNIAPSTHIAVIVEGDGGLGSYPLPNPLPSRERGLSGRHLLRMRWGLIPSWAKDASIGNKLSNARGETVAEKPSFRSAFKQRRCIIPASGFYEWQSVQGVKQPWYVSLKSGEPMAFAGLWETRHAKDGKGEEKTITTCCIITTTANALMETIHDRMPVILDREQWATWLSPQVHETDKLLPMIHPHEAASMQAWQVTREMNRVGLRDDAGLTEPSHLMVNRQTGDLRPN
jgi:putative SOS response-associated peptidase YedK